MQRLAEFLMRLRFSIRNVVRWEGGNVGEGDNGMQETRRDPNSRYYMLTKEILTGRGSLRTMVAS